MENNDQFNNQQPNYNNGMPDNNMQNMNGGQFNGQQPNYNNGMPNNNMQNMNGDQFNNQQPNYNNGMPNNMQNMNGGQFNGQQPNYNNGMPNNNMQNMNGGQFNGQQPNYNNGMPNNNMQNMNGGQFNNQQPNYNTMPVNQNMNGSQVIDVQPVYNPQIVPNYQPQNLSAALQNQMPAENGKFTQEEMNKINELSNSIDLKDSVSIMSYGAAAQNKMIQFSENTLSNVMNKDLGEVGNAITDVVTELKGFDIENETKGKGLFGFFKKAGNNITKLKTKYTNVETNIDNIVKVLEGHQRTLLKDISILDQMYNYNLEYLKELDIYIQAGKQKLNNLMSTEIPALESKALASNTPEDAQMARDIKDLANRFEKRIHDLELTRAISVQTIPQIRLVQNNNVIMSEKIQSTITNTIPLWKNQMVLAIGLHHSNEAAKAQRAVTDTTNELLRKNADMLKTSTITTAEESERGIIDIETLKYTNEQLISTLDEVMKIQTEGREKRRAAEAELRSIENELKAKILNISQK